MEKADNTAAVQLLNGLVTQLGKGDVLSDSFSRHACAALLTVQQAVRACDAQQAASQSNKLYETFQKLLDLVLKRCCKPQGQEQSLALQVLAACIRVCDSVTLLQKTVECGTQLSDVLRKTAANAQQQAGAANGTSSGQPASAPAITCAVIQAACAAAAELCSRQQQYVELPAVRREVSGVAPKLMQPLLSVLDNSSMSDSAQAAALQLAAALMRCVPSSMRPAVSNLERLLQQLVLRAAAGGAGSSVSTAGGPHKQQLLAQAAVCAAMLPAVSGEAAAWSEAARKLLISCHDVLDHLLMGLEGRPVDSQYRSYLGAGAAAQQGQAPAGDGSGGWLTSLPWSQQEQQQQVGVMRRQTVPAMLLSSFCLTALQHLLQQPSAVPVPVPGYSLALLAARLHRFDAAAAVAAGAVPGSSTMYQELLVLQPQLQLAGWQLLQQVVKTCGQQLQLQGLLLRLVRQGMRAVQLSGPAALQQQPVAVRCCMYDTAALLLQATGLAGARGLAAEGMGCVVLELYGHTAAASKAGSAAGQQRPAKRARKSGGASGTELGQFDPAAAVAAAAADDSNRLATATAGDLKVQAAALGVLRGLLAAGGQVLPAEVRAHADAVAYHISASAAQLAVQLAHQPALSAAAAAAGGSGDLAALQVAAYEALLASVLVPCSHRPPFLSQAVVLFRQGRSSSNAAVAVTCQAAALQVEVLLHPRSTAMGTVRQYAGMEGIPALAKPRMWDVFALLQQQQQQSIVSLPGGAGGAAAAAAGATANGIHQMQEGPASRIEPPTAASAPQANAASGAGGAVVMGYPVNGQPILPMQITQQQEQQPVVPQQGQQQALAMQDQPPPSTNQAAQGNAEAPSSNAVNLQAAVQEPDNTSAMLIDSNQPSQPVHEEEEQRQQQQQGGSFGWAPAQPAQPNRPNRVAPQSQAAAVAVAKGPVFEDESSDSEGPLPDIDSGDSSSEEQD